MFDVLIKWFTPLRENFLSFISPVTSFFSSAVDLIVNICGFIRNVLEFIGYGIAVGLRYMWSIIDHLFSLSFWYDLFLVFRDLSVFLGVDSFYLAFMLFVSVIFIVFTFITRLIFGKLSFLNRDKG